MAKSQPKITLSVSRDIPFNKLVLSQANLLHVTAAFAVQYVVGLVIQLWPAEAGHYPAEAYQTALGLNLALQVAAFLWFIRPGRRIALHLPAHPIHDLATSLGLVPAAALSYAHARHAWSLQLVRARAQQQAWRTTAFASFAVLALLVSSLATTVIGNSVASNVIGGAHAAETRKFPDGYARLFKQSVMLDRPAEVLHVSPALRRLYDLMQEGNEGDDEQQR